MKFYNPLYGLLICALLFCDACSTGASVASFRLGGMVTGLSGTVVLQNNGGDNLTLTSNGAFKFSTPVTDLTSYKVTVLTQPESQTCTVSNGSGKINSVSVSDVSVNCVINTYTVTVSGDDYESISPSSSQTIEYGETQSFVVTANTGYTLSSTVGGTCPAGSFAGATYTTGAIIASCTVSFSAINPNAPWYPSIKAFESYNSSRANLFSQATFAGNFSGGSSIDTSASASDYPSVYNMAYLDADNIFAYGGGNGDVSGSIGAYVAKIDPNTLEPVWYTQLVDTQTNSEWDYPGVMGILDDGNIYVVYGYRLSQINPDTGDVSATLVLPTGDGLPENTAFNGFDATSDGVLVMKAVYRQAGCTIQGPDALLDCPDPSDVPASVLISVDPKTMTVLDQVTLSAPTFGRVTVGIHNNQNFVYLSEATTWRRYSVSSSGEFELDNSWNPGTLTLSGQAAASSLVVINDWVIGQSNATPAATELSVVAVDQGDAQNQFSIQPFLGDPIPPLVSSAFSFAAPGGSQAISWAPSSISADLDTNLIYVMDSLPGKLAALSFEPNNGFATVWKASQTTTESVAIIGLEAERIIVGTDIPSSEIPGNNANDYVVWRDAATGLEIARSPLLPQMTSQSLVQPYYSGDLFYGGIEGTLYKLMPLP